MTDEVQEEQEEKLTRRERRAQGKGASPDGDEKVKDRNQRLRADAAAKRRKLRQVEREAAASEGLDASERMDDAMTRSADVTGKFLRENFFWLQWVVIGGFATALGFLYYDYRTKVAAEEEGSKLATVLSAQGGRIASAEVNEPSDRRLIDPRQEFASEEELLNASLAAWQGLKGKPPQFSLLSKLGAANVLYDQEKYSEARKAYQAAAEHGQAKLNENLRGRALEGVFLTLEAEEKYEEATKALDALSKLEAKSFQQLARFHRARIQYLTDETEKAKEALLKLDAELSPAAELEGPQDYLALAVKDLLMTVDPTKAIEEQQKRQALQMEEMMKRIQEMQKQNGGTPAGIPGFPAPPAPAPPASEAPAPTAPAPPATTAPATTIPTPKSPVTPKSTAPKPVAPPAPTPTAPPAPTPTAPKAPAPSSPAPSQPSVPATPPVAPEPQ